jgi:hypothetical protein
MRILISQSKSEVFGPMIQYSLFFDSTTLLLLYFYYQHMASVNNFDPVHAVRASFIDCITLLLQSNPLHLVWVIIDRLSAFSPTLVAVPHTLHFISRVRVRRIENHRQ